MSNMNIKFKQGDYSELPSSDIEPGAIYLAKNDEKNESYLYYGENENKRYSIMPGDTVRIDQGGTGATEPEAALENLTIINDCGGVNIGKEAKSTFSGGAVGNGAKSGWGFAGGYEAFTGVKNSDGKITYHGDGGAVGKNASTDFGGAVGCKATSGNGFAGGYNASTATKNSDGKIVYYNNGGAIGSNALSGSGGAVGYNATSGTGFAGGNDAFTGTKDSDGKITYHGSGGAVGSGASTEDGGAVGRQAKSGDGFAGGRDAKTIHQKKFEYHFTSEIVTYNETSQELSVTYQIDYQYPLDLFGDIVFNGDQFSLQASIDSINYWIRQQDDKLVFKIKANLDYDLDLINKLKNLEISDIYIIHYFNGFGDGGAIGYNAISNYGGAMGYSSIANNGGAIGREAKADSGFAGGYRAETYAGGAIGYGAKAETFGGAVGYGAKTGCGFAGGDNAFSGVKDDNGIIKSYGGGAAIGCNSSSDHGGSVGYFTKSNNGGAIGREAKTEDGGAVGKNASSGSGFAGGQNAIVKKCIKESYDDTIVVDNQPTRVKLEIKNDIIFKVKQIVVTTLSGNTRYITEGIKDTVIHEDADVYIHQIVLDIYSSTSFYVATNNDGISIIELYYEDADNGSGGAVGSGASTYSGGAVGRGATSISGFAGGVEAKATAEGAVQLGTGTNNIADTLQFIDTQIVDANGKIVTENLKNYNEIPTLGKKTKIPANSDFNDYKTPGIYCVDGNINAETMLNCPSDRAGSLIVDLIIAPKDGDWNDNYIYQIYKTLYGQTYERHVNDEGEWTEWEASNPPMEEGIEYRTTERINGLAVYKKNINGTIYYCLEGETNTTDEDGNIIISKWKPYANIVGAAPAWYGFGGDAKADEKSDERFMAIIDECIAQMPRDTIQHVSIHAGGRHSVTIHKHLVDYATIDDVTYEGSVYPHAGYCHRTRAWFAGEWNEWEWVDPPMCLNVEYRTTERWEGRPIYKQLIYFGHFPDNSNRTVTIDIGSDFKIVNYTGIFSDSDGNVTYVSMNVTNVITASWITKQNTKAVVGIETVAGASKYKDAYVELKYIKV